MKQRNVMKTQSGADRAFRLHSIKMEHPVAKHSKIDEKKYSQLIGCRHNIRCYVLRKKTHTHTKRWKCTFKCCITFSCENASAKLRQTNSRALFRMHTTDRYSFFSIPYWKSTLYIRSNYYFLSENSIEGNFLTIWNARKSKIRHYQIGQTLKRICHTNIYLVNITFRNLICSENALDLD